MSQHPDIPVSSPRAPAAALGFLSVAWVFLLVVSPYVVSHVASSDPMFKAGGIVYLAGRIVCHQRADRSFHAWGVQLPVCARCLGLYLGAALGALVGARRAGGRDAGGRRRRDVRAYLAVAATPSAVSVALEMAGVWPQTLAIRAFAALPLGFAVAWFIAAHAQEVFSTWRKVLGL